MHSIHFTKYMHRLMHCSSQWPPFGQDKGDQEKEKNTSSSLKACMASPLSIGCPPEEWIPRSSPWRVWWCWIYLEVRLAAYQFHPTPLVPWLRTPLLGQLRPPPLLQSRHQKHPSWLALKYMYMIRRTCRCNQFNLCCTADDFSFKYFKGTRSKSISWRNWSILCLSVHTLMG